MAEALPHIVDEAVDLVRVGEAQGVTMRLLGGVAVRVRCAEIHAELARDYKDIDLLAPSRTARRVETLFESRGYTQDTAFNTVHGHYRLIYHDTVHGRQVDIFIGKFEMCHRLPLAERLDVHPVTLPTADLLLTKLQVVELTEKDQRDALTLLLDHPIGGNDADGINGEHIARLCAADWGLWRTVTGNLERLKLTVAGYALPLDAQRRVIDRIEELEGHVAGRRKSARWKARAVVGDRVQWYELPEEVESL